MASKNDAKNGIGISMVLQGFKKLIMLNLKPINNRIIYLTIFNSNLFSKPNYLLVAARL